MEEGIIDLKSDAERHGLTAFRTSIVYLVDKYRKLFKLKGMWRRNFNLFLFVLGRFELYGKFLRRKIFLTSVGKDPFPPRRCEFNL
jgi:hypothetical protein